MKITDMQVDEIARLADEADNCVAMSRTPLSDRSIHIEGMRASLENISETIKKWVFEVTGVDPWN